MAKLLKPLEPAHKYANDQSTFIYGIDRRALAAPSAPSSANQVRVAPQSAATLRCIFPARWKVPSDRLRCSCASTPPVTVPVYRTLPRAARSQQDTDFVAFHTAAVGLKVRVHGKWCLKDVANDVAHCTPSHLCVAQGSLGTSKTLVWYNPSASFIISATASAHLLKPSARERHGTHDLRVIRRLA